MFSLKMLAIPLSRMGALAIGLRIFGQRTKNHLTVITDRNPNVTEHYGLVRTLNARTRFEERHARTKRARMRGYNYPVVLEVDKIRSSKAGTSDGKGALGYIRSKSVWLTPSVITV